MCWLREIRRAENQTEIHGKIALMNRNERAAFGIFDGKSWDFRREGRVMADEVETLRR